MKLRIIFKVLLLLSFLVSFTGCWSARELNELNMVLGMGMDKSNTPNKILLTAQLLNPGKDGSQSNGKGVASKTDSAKTFWNVSAAGKTIFEAVREMTHKTGNRLFVSHSQVLIIGSELAKDGIQSYLDFFFRAHESRPTTFIVVSRTNALETLNLRPQQETFSSMSLAKLIRTYKYTSESLSVNLQDFSARMLSKTTCPIAPLIDINEQEDNQDLYTSGVAIFNKNTEMIGYLDKKETRGLLWVLGKVESGVIIVDTPTGEGYATLEVSNVRVHIEPEIDERGQIYIYINIKDNAFMEEQSTAENLAAVPAFDFMQKEQESIIRQEIMNTFKKSQDMCADIYGFGDSIHKKFPDKWKLIGEKWGSIYPKIQLVIQVKTQIRNTDLLSKPVAPID